MRDQVHIRAPAHAVFDHLAALGGYARWLPPAFRGVAGDDRELAFELALPLRRERAQLAIAQRERPAHLLLTDASAGGEGALAELAWALYAESAAEVHLTLEAAWRPAGGWLGALLEPPLYEPLRRQALRDALWRLKLAVERDGAPPP